MSSKWILSILMAAVVGWTQVGCMMPEEGTIIYDQDYPEMPTDNVGGSGSGGGSGGGSGSGSRETGAGFTVTETDEGTSVTESGITDTISVELDTEPTAEVTISLVAVPADQIFSSPSSLTFTPSNWDEPQVVTVSAIEDGDLDGDVTSTLSVLVSGSDDPNYASGIEAQDISVTTIDSGTIILPPLPASGPGITVTQTDGNTVVEESGATDTVTVVLNEQPTGDVTVAIISPDGEINADPAEVTFLASNWDQPQYVTISAVEDGVADDDQDTNFTVAVSNSTDPNYSSELGTIRVPVSVIDSGNVSGIVITSSGGNNQLNENGDGDSFTVALSMQPSADVTITLTDNDSSEISYNPTTLTFTPDNWDAPQTVDLSAPEDNIKDGNQNTLLTLNSASADAASNGLSTSTEVVTVDSATEPGVTITDAPVNLMEGGAKTLSFVLDTRPAAGTVVTITLSDNDSSEISYDPAVLTFTSSNWNTPQTVEVNAVEDGIQDGDQQVSLNISVSSNPSGSYGSAMDTSLTITTQDSGNTPPDSPTGFVATPTLPSGSVDLSWTEPANPAAESYTIYWTDDPSTPIDPSKPSTFTGSINITAPDTAETITGLDPAKDYDFTIVATNSLGDSTPAEEVDATPIPEAPTGLTASAGAASGQVDLKWNPSPGADSYTIYYSNDGGNIFTAISPNVTGTSYPHTGLNDGTEYTYYVVANNAGGASESSDTISATPGVEPPDPPTNLTATAGSAEVTLNWTAVDGADDYTIYVSTGGSDYTAISPDVTGTSFTHTNLTNGTNYYYYVVANNEGGASADSNMVSATPTDSGPGFTAPTVTLTPGEQNITASWGPVDGAVIYNLNWSNTAGSSAEINSVSAQQIADGANPLVFVHAPLVAGVNHTYTIEAVDAEGNIVVSDPETASALPLSCPDTNTTLNQPQNLLAYYNFDGNLEDSAGDFDLTATGDNIVYMKGCANGTSGYFDGDGGYAYNVDFNDNNVTEVADGSWTIALWVNADEDMNKFASMVSTTSVPEEGWGKGFQIDVTSDMRPRFFACKKESECAEEANTETFDTTMKAPKDKALQLGEWTHIAVTMNNQTAVMYINGQEVVSQSGLVTEFNRLKVGLNRWEQQPWKGYLDELMIFGDTLTAEEVMTVYENAQPAKVENVTAVNWDSTIVVAWDAVEGVNEYRVYYSTDGTVDENSPYFTVTGGTVMNHDNVTSGQTYTYAVAGVNKLGVGELSDAVSITIDTDSDLLVYYEFDGDLTDTRRKYNDGRYDLTAVGGATVTYSESRFSGNNAAYFDASNGYVFTENLNDAAEDNLFASKSFTVSVWFYADPDMPDYSSLMSSRYVPEYGNDAGNWSWQLDSAKGQLRWRAATGEKNDTEEIAAIKYSAEEWSHAAFVKHGDDTIEMYLNGSLIHTGVQNNTPLDVLKIGTNRREELPWKGYIDEFKIYERGLSSQEVCNLYNNNSPITTAASCTQESRVAAQDEPAYVTIVDDNTKAVAIEFSPDGSKLYLIVGRANSDHKVVQYNLSTPWDVRTAVSGPTMYLTNGTWYDTYWTNDLVWNPDGKKLIVLNDSSSADQSRIRVYNVPTPYDLGSVVATNPTPEATFSIEVHSAVTIDHPLTFAFNSSGTKMIVGGFDSYASDQERYQRIQEFGLAGSYDFSTITKLSPTPYATFEYGGNDAIDEVIWKADGTKFITLNLNGDVHMYSVSDRFDLSSSTITKDGLVMNLDVPDNQKYFQITKFEGLHFNSSQNRLYYIQNSDSKVLVGSVPFSW